MRERFLQRESFESFAVHELLEMFLYYSIPRNDTNPIAHELLEHFGSLKGIFNASVDELEEIDGIGKQTAVLIKMIPEIARRYADEKLAKKATYQSISEIAQYFCHRFLGAEHECLYMMMFNNRMNMIDCVLISEGTVNSTSASTRMMSEKSLRKKASSVVIAHNHPNGLAIPSSNDLQLTDDLNNALNMVGVTLLEHLIIAEDRFCPIMKQHCGTFRKSPLTGLLESGFYEQFYDVDEKEWVCPPIFE
jgi:DNA repair protein RadC